MALFDWLARRPMVTRPAVWGKLPTYADYVREGVRAGEGEGWQTWITRESVPASQTSSSKRSLPVVFVLAPGSLAFAPRRHVLGVFVASCDRFGRECPLLVYQQAHGAWLLKHLSALRDTALPREQWLFQLSRCVAHHVAQRSTSGALNEAIQSAWDRHVGGPSQYEEHPSYESDDPAGNLLGVRHHPRADWPECLTGSNPRSAFWQQDALGSFVNAADSLRQLQEGSP